MGKMELGLLVSLVILLSLQLGICDAATNTSLGCIERERAALLSFKATLFHPFSNNNTLLLSWNSNNRDCCSWESVTCHKTTGHVISLDLTLGDKPYADSLEAIRVDSSLLELKHLTYLDLSFIDFNYNKFPAHLGSLKQLQYLNLSHTYFSGVVPQNLGNLSSLHILDLTGGYSLEVDDLMWASRLSSLEHLDLSYVNLSTTTHVFEVLNTLPSLLFLRLSWSDLDNTHLPVSSINDSTFLANLQHLDLSGSSFQGEFPCFLPNMTSLTFLDLSQNMFNLSSGTHLLGLKELTHLNLACAYSWMDGKVDWTSELLRDKFHLKTLDLYGNGIKGDILGVFKNFSSHKIESLRLGNNKFYGELPQEVGELNYLTDLDLSLNHLNGSIPASLGKLSDLISLVMFSNNFSDPLPSSLGNLTSLRVLDLHHNQLSGEIPISLGELSHLERFDISLNCFETTFSEAHFAKLSKLEVFRADNNKIRFGVGYDWVPPFQIKRLTLRSSKIGGQFPQWLQTQKALNWLDVSNCSITGTLPAWLRSMNSLYILDLSRNNISGPIPELSSFSLLLLNLCDNMITYLPSNIGHMMPFVRYLDLARNMINGSVPDSLCRMEELSILDLSKNHFSGNLLDCWPSSLEVASLSYNELTGVIPKSIGGASSLLSLHLNANALTGPLPSTLKNCTGLEFLDVGGNNLSGTLPQWIGKEVLQLRFLILRNNDFSGTIPRELCQLSQLQVMDLANNNLTGNIPYCFANFSSMMTSKKIYGHGLDFYGEDTMASNLNSFIQVVIGVEQEVSSQVMKGAEQEVSSQVMKGAEQEILSQVMKGVELEYTTNYEYLVNLDLSRNHLVGQIPWELTNLSGLVGLNLSHNHLKGEIPAKIGDMKSLESLDLSNNNLVGEIPQSLSNLNFLSHLNLSNNDLSGQIPGGRQLQTLEDPSIYQGNPLLCGAPLQRKCDEPEIDPGIENHEEEEEEEDNEDRADKIWFYGIIIVGFATGFWAAIGVIVVKTKWRQAYFRYIEVAMAKMLSY